MKTPKARRDGLLIQDLPNELLIYDQKSHRAHCLNASAASVFRIADGARSVAEIAEAASDSLGAPLSEDLVWLALEELDKNDLLAAPLSRPQGMTRRDVVAAGAAAAVLMPLVLGITAPTAAYAQSPGPSSSGTFTMTATGATG